MPRVHYVKKARVDNPVAKAGESYYWWKFAYRGKSYSKTPPRPSQLTQSEFMSTYLGLLELTEDTLPHLDTGTGFEEFITELTGEIENLASETQDRLDNMPDQLQEGDTGQLMQERIDGLEGWQSDLENVDTDEPDEWGDHEDRSGWAESVREEIGGMDPGIY